MCIDICSHIYICYDFAARCPRLRLIPQHFMTLFERLTKDGEAFVEADKMPGSGCKLTAIEHGPSKKLILPLKSGDFP